MPILILLNQTVEGAIIQTKQLKLIKFYQAVLSLNRIFYLFTF